MRMRIKNEISEKFKNIPVDEDTRIISREQIKIGDYDVIHEKWFWDGIYADSYVFFNEDIKDLSEEDVLTLTYQKKPFATYKKLDTYTFVNFDFTAPY